MNNVDVSIINLLKASNPEIFGLYFTVMGSTPNPNQKTRCKANALFRAYSSESFDSFMQRYRDWINEPRDRFLSQLNVSSQTESSVVEEEVVVEERDELEEDSLDDELESLLIDPRRQRMKQLEFDLFKFLKEKSLDRDYIYLDFEMNTDLIKFYPREMLDMNTMPLLLDLVNKNHDYVVLYKHLNDILWK